MLTKKGVKVNSLVSLKDCNVKNKPVSSTFLAKVVRILGKKKNILSIKVQESGETVHKVGAEIEIKNFYTNTSKYQYVVQFFFHHIKPPQLATKSVIYHMQLGTRSFRHQLLQRFYVHSGELTMIPKLVWK